MNASKRNGIRGLHVLVCACLLIGCEPQVRPRSQRSIVDVILTVRNQSRRTMQVSLESDSLRQELGPIASGASQSFSVPSALAAAPSLLHLKAVGSDGMIMHSENFAVRRGEQVVWSFADTGRGSLVRP